MKIEISPRGVRLIKYVSLLPAQLFVERTAYPSEIVQLLSVLVIRIRLFYLTVLLFISMLLYNYFY